MARFKVFFTPQALEEILSSYEWGLIAWGEDAAQRWLRELHECVYGRLAVFPKSCPLAPESREIGTDIRQLIFQRYRVLFQVVRNKVIILHLHGPYTGSDLE